MREDASGRPRPPGVHVVAGEIHRETMRAANLRTSIALVPVTSSDEVNLKAARHATENTGPGYTDPGSGALPSGQRSQMVLLFRV